MLYIGSNPASYSLVELLSFPRGSGGGLGLRMPNLSGTGDGFGVGDASVEESTVTDQSGSHGRNGGGGGGKKRMDVGTFHEDESSKLVSTSRSNSDLNELNGKRMKPSGSRDENGGSKRKAEANSRTGNKGAEEKCQPEPPKDYIHVRARRGQATDSHSLAERARREKISERMKILQDLVPGCNKVSGKALVLDEIINYIQSLQRQVEFLSMKLEAVNTRLNPTIEGFPSKELATPTFDVTGMIFGLQAPREYAQGPQVEWLDMQSKYAAMEVWNSTGLGPVQLYRAWQRQ